MLQTHLFFVIAGPSPERVSPQRTNRPADKVLSVEPDGWLRDTARPWPRLGLRVKPRRQSLSIVDRKQVDRVPNVEPIPDTGKPGPPVDEPGRGGGAGLRAAG